jgi:very-short-patch-repair endonuclease
MRLRAAEQPPDDTRLGKLAESQHGVVSRRQLLELGFSSQAIKTLVARKRIVRLHRAVYAVGHKRLTAQGRWMAAVLACGPGAVLSHHQAAAHHHLRQIGGGLIHVTAPTRHHVPGIRCHYVRALHPEDAAIIDGIPVTTLARTYLDLAEVLNHRRLLEALEAGERLDKLDLRAIEATISRNPDRRAIKPLRSALTQLDDDPPWLQSPTEQAFRDIVRSHGLPEPQYNVYVEGELVDAVWSAHRLVVEVDGWGYHRSKRSFTNDRRRDRVLVAAGWRVVRFTSDDVADHLGAVAAELSELVRGGPWPPPVR